MKLKKLIYERIETSVSEFARKVGLSRQTVVNVLNGKKPSLLTTVKVCRYFGVNFENYLD